LAKHHNSDRFTDYGINGELLCQVLSLCPLEKQLIAIGVTTMSGEMLLAVSYGFVMILGGVFIWWDIKNYYYD
jgi:hypothetical protein|tara:strand:- start:770 stop:988 length:219 start_codon:yes stop_codon:yes gene_type:complete